MSEDVTIAPEQTVSEGPPGGRGFRRDAVLDRGAAIGRYVVIARLGSGAMGSVYSAYDPELDRKVAVKLLDAPGMSSQRRRQKLMTEAQALGRLSHPNVVSVHDVGTHDRNPFIAMEYVDGVTLGTWLDDAPRSAAEIVAALCEAGRGLAAAHDAGMIHRDFKPDNVMVDRDGRVRVADFGLARQLGLELSGSADDDELDSSFRRHRVDHLARAAGTPAYMAPEQHERDEIDARADQFAFCVTLYEALYGARPFPGSTPAEIAASVTAGELVPPAPRTDLPRSIREALVRGLSLSRSDRFASMHDLLAVLERDHRAIRRRWLILGAGVLAVGGFVGWNAFEQARLQTQCRHAAAEVDDDWNDDRRTLVRSGLDVLGRDRADATWARVESRIDDFRDQWRETRSETCRWSRLDPRPEPLPTAADACLAEGRAALGTTVKLLAEGEQAAASHAVELLAELPRPESCADERTLLTNPRWQAETEPDAELLQMQAELFYARALVESERLSAAQTTLDALSTRATRAEQWGAAAEARLGLARIQLVEANGGGAEQTLLDVLELATRHDLHKSELDAKIALVRACTARDGGLAQAELWARLASADLDGAIASQEVALHLAEGHLHRVRGRAQEAIASFERALRIRREFWGREDPAVVDALIGLGRSQRDAGDHQDATATLGEAEAVAAATYGAIHPRRAEALSNLSEARRMAGELDEALAAATEAVSILEAVHGAGHPTLVTVYNVAGSAHASAMRFGAAKGYYAAALEILEAHPELGDRVHATLLANAAAVQQQLLELDEARPKLERVIDIFEADLGPDHPQVSVPMSNLASLELTAGNYDRAVSLFERSLAIRQGTYERDDSRLAIPMVGLGEAYWRLGQVPKAIEHLEHAIALFEGGPPPAWVVGGTRALYAMALWDAGRRDEARSQARQATPGLESADPADRNSANLLAELNAWSSQHDP